MADVVRMRRGPAAVSRVLLVCTLVLAPSLGGMHRCRGDILVGDLGKVNNRDAPLVATGNGVFLRRQNWSRMRTLDGKLLGEGNPYSAEFLVAPHSLSDFDAARKMSREDLLRDLRSRMGPDGKFPLDDMSWCALVGLYVYSHEERKDRAFGPDVVQGWLHLDDNVRASGLDYDSYEPLTKPRPLPEGTDSADMERLRTVLRVHGLRRGSRLVVETWGDLEESAYGEQLRKMGVLGADREWLTSPGVALLSPYPPVNPGEKTGLGRQLEKDSSTHRIGGVEFYTLAFIKGGLMWSTAAQYWYVGLAPGIGRVYEDSISITYALDRDAVYPRNVRASVTSISEILLPERGFYWRLSDPDATVLEILAGFERHSLFPEGTELPGTVRQPAGKAEERHQESDPEGEPAPEGAEGP